MAEQTDARVAPTERRSGKDRRQVDKGPPTPVERRRGVEARRPEIVELDMSISQWQTLVQQAPAPQAEPSAPPAESDAPDAPR